VINSNRINQICEFVDEKKTVEIGADHGYITKKLFETKKIDYAILTDISDKCLDKAKHNLVNYKCDFFVGDGFDALQNSLIDDKIVCVIAGMGGNEIVNIISKPNNFKKFVLQPQRNVIELRIFLSQNGFFIKKDVMTKDGKIFYNVLQVEKSEKFYKLSQNEILFGKSNLKGYNPFFIEYLEFEIQKNSDIIKNKNVKEINDLLKKQICLYNKLKGKM